VHQTLIEEIRGSFKSQDELTIGALQNMKYLNACLEEGLRIFPPAPVALPRVSPQGGATVCSRFVPEGVSNYNILVTAALCCISIDFANIVKTIVGVCGWAASHSASNFFDPDSYVPERWLGGPQFAGDNKKAAQAFSYGPTNCIGKK
jgi:cytochrome P450